MPQVCGSCRRIVQTFERTVMPVLDDDKRRKFSNHHSSAHDLYESVAKGCWICSRVLARWSDHGALDLRQSEFSAEFSRYCIGSKDYLNRYSGASRKDGFIIARSDSSGTDDWVCFDARETGQYCPRQSITWEKILTARVKIEHPTLILQHPLVPNMQNAKY